MKKLNNIFALIMAIIAIAFTGCSDSFKSGLQLNEDVAIKSITLDNYAGVCDLSKRTVTVAVPSDYDVSAMTITKLELPEGATSSLDSSQALDCSLPVDFTVTNGDVYLEYTMNVVRDNAQILTFKVNELYSGRIDQSAGTIAITVPVGVDITQMRVAFTTTDGAETSINNGDVVDFSNPVTITADYNTAHKEYTITVVQVDSASVAFVGTASSVSALERPEEKAAAEWMLANVPMSEYISFDDVASGKVDLNVYKVVWWHWHADNGDNPPLPEAATNAISAFKTYYDNGGNLLLTRYGTFYLASLGIAKDSKWPNNSWGGYENSPEITTSPWSFSIEGNESHALFQGLIYEDGETSKVYTCDTGYGITNSTAQWHIGTDWGDYKTLTDWRNLTGGIDLAHGGDGAVVIAEFEPRGTSGRVLCIGSGCYDWYSSAVTASADYYHFNVEQMTLNAINYLSEDEN